MLMSVKVFIGSFLVKQPSHITTYVIQIPLEQDKGATYLIRHLSD